MPTDPFVPHEEFRQRTAAVQRAMAERGIDLLILDQSEKCYYLLGYSIAETFYRACLVPATGEPVMVLRKMDVGPCEERTWIDGVIGFDDWDDPIEVIARVVGDKGWPVATIGVEKMSYNLPAGRYEALCAAFAGSRMCDFPDVLDALMWRKSPSEIACLARACEITDATFRYLVDNLAPGLSSRDLAAMAAERSIRLGADSGPIGRITVANDDRHLHANLKTDPIEPGNVVHIELVPKYEGYSARIMRPVLLGGPDPERAAKAERIVAVQDRQLAAMRPGVAASDIDAIIRDGLKAEGLKESYSNISGYTLGYYALYPCRASDFSRVFSPRDQWLLQSGMAFHMYTSVDGLAFSETVVITETGMERLTKTERRMFRV
jgi:Xaa-Pro aminopeptidase